MCEIIETNFDYLRTVIAHDLKVFQENLETGKCIAPHLEHIWKGLNFAIFFITDVDGVIIQEKPLPILYFEHLFEESERYAKYSDRILRDEEQIDISGNTKPFDDIAECLFKADLTWEDHVEACRMSVIKSKVSPYFHEAIAELYKIPSFLGMGLDSTSWIESLNFLAQYKKLPISMSEGSWLQFHKNKFTGRYFLNYGVNKFGTGMKMLERVNCTPDLKINKTKTDILTLSDTRCPDGYFRKLVGLGGMSLWVDKSVQERIQVYPQQPVIEINIPEALNDMRILTYPIKHFYRAKIITALNSPRDLNVASHSVKKLVDFAQEYLKLTDEKLLKERSKIFVKSSQQTLISLSKFDFPRYSTGIDDKHLDLLAEQDVERKKEVIYKIIDVYIQNFPEGLAEENWLNGFM